MSKNKLKNTKIKEAFELLNNVDCKSVVITKHFRESATKNRGLNLSMLNSKQHLCHYVLKDIAIENIKITTYKGKKRIIIDIKGIYIVIAENSLRKNGRVVFITVLSNKMNLLGRVQKFKTEK